MIYILIVLIAAALGFGIGFRYAMPKVEGAIVIKHDSSYLELYQPPEELKRMRFVTFKVVTRG